MKTGKGKISLISAFFLLTVVATLGIADQKKGSADSLLIRPDLRILSVKAERTGFTADGSHRVQVRVTVINSAPGPVCASNFRVKLEKKAPGGASSNLGSQSVARLCANPASAKAATVTLVFDDVVPGGQQRIWLATADSSGVVVETGETNNQGESATYVAKTFCPGVDIVLTKVEVVRGSSGVFIKAFGKNRCIGTCSARIQALFEVADPVVDELGVIIPMGDVSAGLLEYESGMVGVYSRSDRSVTYRVTIQFYDGSCADSNFSNNSCLVTLRADETRKTVNCH